MMEIETVSINDPIVPPLDKLSMADLMGSIAVIAKTDYSDWGAMASAVMPKAPQELYPEPQRGYSGYQYGYASWKYHKRRFRNVVNRLAQDIPGVMRQCGADFIVVQGTSGSFAAAALQMVLDVPIMLLRKETEKSHGQSVECSSDHTHRRALILDDLICSGDTIHKIITQLPRECETAGIILHHGIDEAQDRTEPPRLHESSFGRFRCWKYK